MIRQISEIRVATLNLDTEEATGSFGDDADRTSERPEIARAELVGARGTDLSLDLGLEGARGGLRSHAGLPQALDRDR